MILYLDIETLPCSDPAVIEEITAGVKPPGNLKKEETIAAWWSSDGEQAKKDAIAKTSFDAMYGRIACICAATNDDEPVAFFDQDEKDLLVGFNAWLYDVLDIELYKSHTQPGCTFCGHNLAGFDLPFMKHRSIINSVKPHHLLIKAMNAKPWDSVIADTMLMWSQEREKRASMDRLCKALGINGKDGFDGSMVADTWPVDPQKVIDYCADDVRRTREIYKRITFL